jgi:hypothetical protein
MNHKPGLTNLLFTEYGTDPDRDFWNGNPFYPGTEINLIIAGLIKRLSKKFNLTTFMEDA